MFLLKVNFSLLINNFDFKTFSQNTNAGRQMTFHPFSSRRTWLYDVGKNVFTELDVATGLLFDKRIGASCAALITGTGDG